MIFGELSRLECDNRIEIVEIVSHINDDVEWLTYNMTHMGLVLNEAARSSSLWSRRSGS